MKTHWQLVAETFAEMRWWEWAYLAFQVGLTGYALHYWGYF
jgi:hypothetical protein